MCNFNRGLPFLRCTGQLLIKSNTCMFLNVADRLFVPTGNRHNVQIEERSSQLLRNLSSCEKKA